MGRISAVSLAFSTAPSESNGQKKIKFNMSSKLQIIPNNRQGQLNTGYIGTIAGVLKLAEIVRYSFVNISYLRTLLTPPIPGSRLRSLRSRHLC